MNSLYPGLSYFIEDATIKPYRHGSINTLFINHATILYNTPQ